MPQPGESLPTPAPAGQHWDAFVGSEGCSLVELVRRRGRLDWPEALSLLEQLSSELVCSCADDTVPESLSVDQVWIQPSGRVQLLDVPLGCGNDRVEIPGDALQRAMGLLAQTARLALEGRLVAGKRKRPISAPLPGQAAGVMNRLTGAGLPFAHVQEVQIALEECYERPTHVSRMRRGIHLAMLALLLGPGLAMMFLAVPGLLYGRFADRFFAGVMGESALIALEESRPYRTANLVGLADPLTQAAMVSVSTRVDQRADQLRERLHQGERERAIALASTSGFLQRLLDRLRAGAEQLAAHTPERTEHRGNFFFAWLFLDDMHRDLEGTQASLRPSPGEYLLDVGLIAFWPILWTLWGATTRGGLSRWLAGIKLLDAEGRPASRFRCAWRSIILWAPLLILLALSLGLDLWRINRELAGGFALASAVAWLAWLTNWLAIILLGVYLWLAQRRPGRGWHDRLVGTYPVPR